MFEAIFLGIVQGLTEFIPVSSSAHLALIPWLLGGTNPNSTWNSPLLRGVAFDAALHLGTLLAVISYFRREWVLIVGAGFRSVFQRRLSGTDITPEENFYRRLAWYLVLATIPAGLAGAILNAPIEDYFHPTEPDKFLTTPALLIMAGGLAIMGLVLLLVERFFASNKRDLKTATLKDALLVGCAQALALIPGVSRSGSTITAGLLLGFQRSEAARFSFLLSTPIVVVVGLKSLYDLARRGLNSSEIVSVLAGFTASAIVGYLCIAFLLSFLRTRSTLVFVIYRWLLAGVIIALVIIRA